MYNYKYKWVWIRDIIEHDQDDVPKPWYIWAREEARGDEWPHDLDLE
jgi:hypothetical protein